MMIEYMGLLSHDDWRDWRMDKLHQRETDTRLPEKHETERKQKEKRKGW